MWIFLNTAMISVVQNESNPDLLHVRARIRGDLQQLFPRAKVTETHGVGRDYRFRCDITRGELAVVLVNEVNYIDYTNFKSSIPAGKLGDERHGWYMDVWCDSVKAQRVSSRNNGARRRNRKLSNGDFVDPFEGNCVGCGKVIDTTFGNVCVACADKVGAV